MNILKNDWAPLLQEEFEKEYYLKLRTFLKEEYKQKVIYPDMYDLFNALHFTSYADTKAVILGQDPYHGPNQAHGLSFSVNHGIKLPPSLRNIYKELEADLDLSTPEHGNLVKWAESGVLMLNTILTVQQGQPNSHKGKGWEQFTDKIIRLVNEKTDPVVFILWGRYAQSKADIITNSNHLIIQSPHPSPFSANRGFFGSKPFTRANAFLEEVGREPIDWSL